MRKNQYLLLEDVDGLGRAGEIVDHVRPGFLRNFLLPQQKVVKAGLHTVKKQERLQAERAQRAKVDLQESLELAEQLKTLKLEVQVEVNPNSEMYGSIALADIVHLLQERGYTLDKKMVRLTHPIKRLGEHLISLKLKEGVEAEFTLQVSSKADLVDKQPQQTDE